MQTHPTGMFASTRAWNDISFYQASLAFPMGLVGEGVINVTMIAVFVLLALFARKVAPLYIRSWATCCVGSSFGAGFSDFLMSAGYAFMFLVLTILLCDLSHRYGISVLVLCGIQEAATIFMVAGHHVAPVLNQLAESSADGATTVTIVLTILVVATASLFLKREILHEVSNCRFGWF